MRSCVPGTESTCSVRADWGCQEQINEWIKKFVEYQAFQAFAKILQNDIKIVLGFAKE